MPVKTLGHLRPFFILRFLAAIDRLVMKGKSCAKKIRRDSREAAPVFS